MSKTNAQKLVDAGNLNVAPVLPTAIVRPGQDDTAARAAKVIDAMHQLAGAFTLEILVPSTADDAQDVEIVSDEQTGEVETVRVKSVNRYGRQLRGLLGQVLRQLDFSISAGTKELEDGKRDIANALRNMQRQQDPAKLLDFIDSKTKWADVIADQVSHAQAMRDAADEAFLDIMGVPYTPYEKRPARTVTLPVANDTPVDPRIAAAMKLVNG